MGENNYVSFIFLEIGKNSVPIKVFLGEDNSFLASCMQIGGFFVTNINKTAAR